METLEEGRDNKDTLPYMTRFSTSYLHTGLSRPSISTAPSYTPLLHPSTRIYIPYHQAASFMSSTTPSSKYDTGHNTGQDASPPVPLLPLRLVRHLPLRLGRHLAHIISHHSTSSHPSHSSHSSHPSPLISCSSQLIHLVSNLPLRSGQYNISIELIFRLLPLSTTSSHSYHLPHLPHITHFISLISLSSLTSSHSSLSPSLLPLPRSGQVRSGQYNISIRSSSALLNQLISPTHSSQLTHNSLIPLIS